MNQLSSPKGDIAPYTSPIIRENDYYLEAVATAQELSKKQKHFAECCANVSGKRTQALAQDCGLSVDSIEQYRNTYFLYTTLQDYFRTSERVRKLWETAPFHLWRVAAQLHVRLNLSLDKTLEYLATAGKQRMTREQFAAHVDEKENDTPKWKRRLLSAMRLLKPSKDDYKSEMPPKAQARYEQWISYSARELEEIAEMEE